MLVYIKALSLVMIGTGGYAVQQVNSVPVMIGTGGYAVQQVLAEEAAGVVWQALSLARRLGHARVTPLHVASAMLSAPAGLLSAACLHSHSHPLQCKALELCFNVALDHLPTTGLAAVMLQQRSHAPEMSNALVAAIKRAKAHQHRGSLDVKVTLEKLIVSILDDPSVSRVMREAGFSSSQVKADVEMAVSLDQQNTTGSKNYPNSCHTNRQDSKAKADDAVCVLDCMASGRKRCMVVVGESMAAARAVVKAVMVKVSQGDLQHHHECLKNLQFVPLFIASLQRMSREEVDAKASDLRALVRDGCASGNGVVLVLEDFSYAADAWAAARASEKRRGVRVHGHYCPVDHVVTEVSSLVRGGRGHVWFWLLGFGSYSSYTNSRAGQPSLEAVWEIHPIVVPGIGGDSKGQASQERRRTGWPAFVGAAAGDSELTCLGTEAATATASLPSWLHCYQDRVLNRSASSGATLQLQHLCNKCNSSCSASGFTHCYTTLISKPWQVEPRQPWPNHRHDDPMAKSQDHGSHANPNPEFNGQGTREASCRRPKFTELTAENLKILRNALEMRIPWHKDIIPDIAITVLKCRSGTMKMMRRRSERSGSATWLLFHGRDSGGKKAMAQELAKLVFESFTQANSYSNFDVELILKRQKSLGNELRFVERLYEVVKENPHRLIMIDGIDQLDCDSEFNLKNAIENGRMRGCNGDEVSLEDAIIVLSCEAIDSKPGACCPWVKKTVSNSGNNEEDGIKEEVAKSHRYSLDLNASAGDTGEEEDSSLDDEDVLGVVDGVFLF